MSWIETLLGGGGVEGFFVDRVAGSPCDHWNSGAGGDAELDAVDLKGEGDGGPIGDYYIEGMDSATKNAQLYCDLNGSVEKWCG